MNDERNGEDSYHLTLGGKLRQVLEDSFLRECLDVRVQERANHLASDGAATEAAGRGKAGW